MLYVVLKIYSGGNNKWCSIEKETFHFRSHSGYKLDGNPFPYNQVCEVVRDFSGSVPPAIGEQDFTSTVSIMIQPLEQATSSTTAHQYLLACTRTHIFLMCTNLILKLGKTHLLSLLETPQFHLTLACSHSPSRSFPQEIIPMSTLLFINQNSFNRFCFFVHRCLPSCGRCHLASG